MRIRTLAAAAAALLAAQAATAKILTKEVTYKDGDTVLEGVVAYDDRAKGRRPGVLVVHEWTGINDYVKRRVRQLAELGYVAFAADIYGKGVRPPQGPEAAKVSALYKNDRPLMRRRAQLGLDALRRQKNVDPGRLAATGYCFGGTVALELARSGADIRAVVSFHGGLETPMKAEPGNLKAKVLVLHGADDPYVPAKEVAAFEQEMRDARADWQLVAYGNAVHAFTNPDAGDDNAKGAAYNAAADRRSWEAMKDFFAETFQSSGRG